MQGKVEICGVNTSKLAVLDSATTRRLLLRVRQGDKAAREELIAGNLRLVLSVIQRFSSRGENIDDLFQVGCIGLIKAISSFDAVRGKLSTYASRCIDNELLMLLRSRKKNAREVSLYEPIGTDKEGNEINLLDIIEQEQTDVVEQLDLKENTKKLQCLLNEVLNDREREIIFLRYGLLTGKEVTQREIGEALHISRSYVSRIEKRALLKLREGFENGNN